MAFILAANALTTVADLVTEGRDLGTADANLLTRLISVASGAIEKFCNRQFGYQAGIVEQIRSSRGAIRLVLDRAPIVGLVSSITIQDLPPNGAFLVNDGTDFTIEDASKGFLYRDNGFPSSELGGLGAAYEPVVGVAKPRWQVTYAGGFVLPGTAWAAAAAIAGGAFAIPKTNAGVNVFQASAAGGTTGAGEPAWPGAVGGTVTDNGITWTNVGPRTLPWDLEQCCIDAVVDLYRRRAGPKNVTNQKVGDAQRQLAADGALLSPYVQALLMPHKRIF